MCQGGRERFVLLHHPVDSIIFRFISVGFLLQAEMGFLTSTFIVIIRLLVCVLFKRFYKPTLTKNKTNKPQVLEEAIRVAKNMSADVKLNTCSQGQSLNTMFEWHMAASLPCHLIDTQWRVSASPAAHGVSWQTGHVRRRRWCQLAECCPTCLFNMTDNHPQLTYNLKKTGKKSTYMYTCSLSHTHTRTLAECVTAVEIHIHSVLIDLILTGPDFRSRKGIVCSLHVYSHLR